MRLRLERGLVVCVVAACACTGSIGDLRDGTGGPTGELEDDEIAPPGVPPERIDPTDPEQARACAPSIPPAPLRRLSYSEYQATLKNLFSSLDIGTPQLLRDPAEHGFENRVENLNPVLQLVEQYGTAAQDIGVMVAENLSSIVPCAPENDTEEKACGEQFIAEFGRRVFRRPLTDEEMTDFAGYFEAERAISNFRGAVQMTTEVLLQSPQFLYRLELGDPAKEEADRIQLTSYEIASRIAFLFAGSAPDDDLLAAAASGSLETEQGRETEARRLLADERSAAMMIEFHRQWLDFDRLDHEPKDAATYPSYDDALKNAIREESNRFVRQIFWEGDGTLEAFLTSTQATVNGPLAELYGVDAPGNDWQEVTLNADERAGWITRANFLASRAHKLEASPPLRSVFILEKFFCIPPPVPPANADLSEPRAKAGAEPRTNRELFEQRIEPEPCNTCHSQIDTIGYGLEHYDAIGRYRVTDNGFPVNAQGEIINTDVDGTFSGGVELSERLAESEQVRVCAAENWFSYALGREIGVEDECRFGKLNLALAEAGGDIREMLVSLVKSPEFVYRPPVETP